TGVRAAFEYRGEIVTVPAEKGDPRNLTNSAAVHERSPAWSPDGRYVALRDNARVVSIVEVESGRQTTVATEPTYRPGAFADSSYDWSPDSKWLVYTLFSAAQIESAYLYSVTEGKSYPLTDG